MTTNASNPSPALVLISVPEKGPQLILLNLRIEGQLIVQGNVYMENCTLEDVRQPLLFTSPTCSPVLPLP